MSKYFFKFTVFLISLVLVAYTQTVWADSETSTYTYATPDNSIPGLENFAKISDELYIGAQPTAEGFAQLKKMGIKTIINLRAWHSDKKMIKGQGLYYVNLPTLPIRVGDTEVAAFLKVVAHKEYAPFFVHCHLGADRTLVMTGIYRITVQGWPKEKVQGELKRFGFHEIFFNLRRYLRNVDLQALKIKIDSIWEPKFEYIP